jgi:deazaflavin-dependent oxidoreductase (nitroreductase family)
MPFMAESFLYLTTTGRTTGQPRELEIWFVEHDGRYYLCAQNRERAQWVKNLEADPKLSFTVGTRDDRESQLARLSGTGRVVHAEKEPELVRTICARFNKKYGWSDGLVVELMS